MKAFLGGVRDAFKGRYRVAEQLPPPETVTDGARIVVNGTLYEAFRWTDDAGPPTHWSRIG